MSRARIEPDQFDLEQLRQACESPGFARITERIRETAKAEAARLLTVPTWDECKYLQGVIHGLEVASQVPKILLQELHLRAKKGRADVA